MKRGTVLCTVRRLAITCAVATFVAGCLRPSIDTVELTANAAEAGEAGPRFAHPAATSSSSALANDPVRVVLAETPNSLEAPILPEPTSAPLASAARTPAPEGSSRNMLALPPHLRHGPTGPDASASVAASLAGTTATTGPQPGTARQSPRRAAPIKLADAVANALMTYPELRVSEARAREAKAGVNIARAALFPTADIRLAAGMNVAGSYEGTTIPYKTSTNTLDGRMDGGLILRQLVYDFGAARSDIERAELLRDAEKLKVRDKIDDIAFKTTQTFLRVLEQRALVSLVDEIIRAHEQLARVVQAHATEGHGTIADVQRVNSRLVDVRAIRSDVSLQLKAAEDQFERFTRQKPDRLVHPPDVRRGLPGSPDSAISQMLANNPRLAALQSTTQSSRKELESQRAGVLPRINLEIETEAKNFRNGPDGRSQGEARAMLSMRYRLMDGGLSEATQQQIHARIEGGEFSYLNERQQLESDIRQAYRAIESSGRKLKLVSEGVNSATKVRELYLEQFKGGKRTVFELLDSQMSFFTIRRNQIENQFEGQRAMFDILRATGSLAVTLAK